MSEYRSVVDEIVEQTDPTDSPTYDIVDTFVYGYFLSLITKVLLIRRDQKGALEDET